MFWPGYNGGGWDVQYHLFGVRGSRQHSVLAFFDLRETFSEQLGDDFPAFDLYSLGKVQQDLAFPDPQA